MLCGTCRLSRPASLPAASFEKKGDMPHPPLTIPIPTLKMVVGKSYSGLDWKSQWRARRAQPGRHVANKALTLQNHVVPSGEPSYERRRWTFVIFVIVMFGWFSLVLCFSRRKELQKHAKGIFNICHTYKKKTQPFLSNSRLRLTT